jgi:hypothetical protein
MCVLFIFLQLASQILSSLSKENNGPYASNWLERLRQIKRIQNKVMKLDNGSQSTGSEPMTVVRGQGTGLSTGTGGTMMMVGGSGGGGGRSKVQMSDFTEYT